MPEEQNNISNRVLLIFVILLVIILFLSLGWLFNAITENACQMCELNRSSTTEGPKEESKEESKPEFILDGKFIKYEDDFIYVDSQDGEKKKRITTSTSFVKIVRSSVEDDDPQKTEISVDKLNEGDPISIMLDPASDNKVAEKVRKIIIGNK